MRSFVQRAAPLHILTGEIVGLKLGASQTLTFEFLKKAVTADILLKCLDFAVALVGEEKGHLLFKPYIGDPPSTPKLVSAVASF